MPKMSEIASPLKMGIVDHEHRTQRSCRRGECNGLGEGRGRCDDDILLRNALGELAIDEIRQQDRVAHEAAARRRDIAELKADHR